MTIEATQKTGDEIRLSDQGKENAAELDEIRKTLPEMPVMQVMDTNAAAKPVVKVSHATFVGWLNDAEVLILEDGMLTALDIAKQSRRKSGIKVTKDSFAFVR